SCCRGSLSLYSYSSKAWKDLAPRITSPKANAVVCRRSHNILNASIPSEIDASFATMRQQRVGALLVGADPFLSSRTQQIVALAAREAIPAMYANRNFVEEGGLMSYGNDTADSYRRAGVHVGRILNGAAPADLPVDQATSNSSSMSKPRKRSALRFLNRFSPAPTR